MAGTASRRAKRAKAKAAKRGSKNGKTVVTPVIKGLVRHPDEARPLTELEQLRIQNTFAAYENAKTQVRMAEMMLKEADRAVQTLPGMLGITKNDKVSLARNEETGEWLLLKKTDDKPAKAGRKKKARR